MNKLVVVNWKDHPANAAAAKTLAQAEDQQNVVICPPARFLPDIALRRSQLGAQDFDLPPEELERLGARYVILGHSERRKNLGETDAVVNQKVVQALQRKLTPILCLGEDWEQQFQADTASLSPAELGKIIYVYEPLGAISTQKHSKPVPASEATAVIERIRKLAGENAKVLYGGTVNKDNAAEYGKYPEIDGVLVGAASLDPENFKKIYDIFSR